MISKLKQKFNRIKHLLGSRILTELFILDVEKFKRKDGTIGTGVRFACNEGYTIRFNFNKGTKRYIIDKDCLVVDSIDLWDIKDINNFEKPTYTIEFYPNTNILENWHEILINFINHRFKPYNAELNEANISDLSKNILGFFKTPYMDKRASFIRTNSKAKRLINDKKYLYITDADWKDVLSRNDILQDWYTYSKSHRKSEEPAYIDDKQYKNTTSVHRLKFSHKYPEAKIPVSAMQISKKQWEDMIAELGLEDKWDDFLRDENIRVKNRTNFTKDEDTQQYFKNPSINKKAVFIKNHPEYKFPLNSMHYVKNEWEELLNRFNLKDEWDEYEKTLKQEKEGQLNSKWQIDDNTYKNKTFNTRATFMRMHADCNIPRNAIRLSNNEFIDIIKKNGLEDEWNEYINNQYSISKIVKNKTENNTVNDYYKDMVSDQAETGSSNSKEVFKRLSIGLDMLLRSPTQRSMIVVGSPGTGKTYTIKDFLEEMLGKVGDKWEYAVLSRISDGQLYETLFRNRNKILVLDEATSFLTDGKNTAVQDMLKSTLQSIRLSNDEMKEFYGKMKSRRQSNTVLPIRELKKDDVEHSTVVYYKTRSTHKFIDANDENEIIRYCQKLDRFILKGGQVGEDRYRDTELVSMALPERFFYNGKIIFISNNKLEDVNDAIKDRSYVVSIDLNKEGMINRIKEVAGNIFDEEDINTVVHEILKSSKQISLRSFFSAMNAYATNPDNDYWRIAATL